MAVQAQYPSNVFLLNRKGHEQKDMILGGDYLLQSSQPSEFIHQSMIPDNGGAINPRKRGREAVAAAPINLFSLQSQHPSQTLVNLAHLHNQHQGAVSTGLRLSFEEQQQQQMGLVQSSSTSILSSFLSEDLAAQIKHQRDEIDQLLQAQGDQLRRTLAERRERHYRALLSAAEESASRRLKETDAEMEKAARRNAELEERAAHLKAKAQVWQDTARAQEAIAASLQAQLQQAMMVGSAQAQDKRDEMGCAGGDTVPADDAESAYVDPSRFAWTVPPCRACRKRVVSVVLLPCRHLCLCSACESAVDTCPLCQSVRSASVQVYLL